MLNLELIETHIQDLLVLFFGQILVLCKTLQYFLLSNKIFYYVFSLEFLLKNMLGIYAFIYNTQYKLKYIFKDWFA